jgi:hypothetical protein
MNHYLNLPSVGALKWALPLLILGILFLIARIFANLLRDVELDGD